MPKRPLSAYNLYFQAERSKILAKESVDGKKIGFEGLGKIIGKQWRDLCTADKKEYERLAERDSERYRKEMEAYNEQKAKRFEEEDHKHASDMSSALLAAATPVAVNASSMVVPPPNLSTHHQHDHPALFSDQSGSKVFLSAGGSHRPAGIPAPVPSPYSGGGHILHRSPTTTVRPIGSQDLNVPPASSHLFPHHPCTVVPEVPSFLPGAGGSDGASGNNSNFALPPGMEIVLSDSRGVDRKYRVHYTCYSMTREAAHQYLESFTGTSAQSISGMSHSSNRHNGSYTNMDDKYNGPPSGILQDGPLPPPSTGSTGPCHPPVASPSIRYMMMPPPPPPPYGGGWR
jgi:hypothetical protein